MFQAIETKYHAATNHRGTRYSARAASGLKVTIPCDYALDYAENHALACRALMDKLEWEGTMVGGSTKDGYAWVFTSKPVTEVAR